MESANHPVSVTVQITERCNLRCTHCAVDSAPDRKPAWTEEMVEQLFDQIGNSQPILDLTGGEPLMAWPILHRFGAEAARRSILWGFTSNGTLMDEQKAQTLKALNVYAVKISLDGLRTSHERVRGPGSFERAVRAIRILRAKDITVGVQTALGMHNISDLPELIQFLDDDDVNTLILFPLMPMGRQAGNTRDVVRGTALRDLVLSVRGQTTRRLRIHMELPQCGSLMHAEEDNVSVRCIVGHMLHFTAGGEAWPCPIYPYRLGTLHDDTVLSLMDHKLQAALRSRDGILGACGSCRSFSKCGGGCRAVAFMSSNNIYAPDPYCWEC
jgi:radical SAM protein with 4Fe4S-binding SPASM domain